MSTGNRSTNEPVGGGGNEPVGGGGNEPVGGGGLEPVGGGGNAPAGGGGGGDEPVRGEGHGAASRRTPDAALLAQALAISAAALRRPNDPPGRPELVTRGLRKRLAQWEPWVRISMAQQALLSGLVFEGRTLWLAPGFDAEGRSEGDARRLLTLDGPVRTLDAQLQRVRRRASERPDRLPEILVQREELWPFWSAVTNIVPAQAPWTYELLKAAAQLSPAIGLRFKHAIGCPRPVDLSPAVQPPVATPGHAAFPSGHATAAFLIVGLLTALLGVGADHPVRVQLLRLAQRIADNRVVAGLHYPVDSAAGCVLGSLLADVVIARCRGGALPTDLQFAADEHTVDDFALDDGWAWPRHAATLQSPGSVPAAVSAVPLLQALWREAETELALLGLRT